MTQLLDLPCPLCGNGPMQLVGNPHGEQYYRCLTTKCWGSRDTEGASFRENSASGRTREFVRTDRYGTRTVLTRSETAPLSQLEPIPGQPGLFRDPHNPERITNARDFFVAGKQLCRGSWSTAYGEPLTPFGYSIQNGGLGRANPNDLQSRASQLEVLMIDSLTAEPQRTIARMFAVVERGGELPRITIPVNRPPPRTSEAAMNYSGSGSAFGPPPLPPSTEPENKMTDDAPSTKSRIMDQGKDIGAAMLDGLAEATVEEAGDVLLDMAKELFDGEPILQLFLASPDGRELVKGLMALVIDSAAVHTSIPKASALRKLARYQFRSSARRVGGPRIKKVMTRFSKLIELSERLPELPEGEANVVDFAAAATAKASVGR